MDNGTNKTSTIGVRVNEHFRTRVEKCAAARKQKLSDFIRETVEREITAWEEAEKAAGMNKKYFIKDGQFYILEEELEKQMKELEPEEFLEWYKTIVKENE